MISSCCRRHSVVPPVPSVRSATWGVLPYYSKSEWISNIYSDPATDKPETRLTHVTDDPTQAVGPMTPETLLDMASGLAVVAEALGGLP